MRMEEKFGGVPTVVAYFDKDGTFTKTEEFNLENIKPLEKWEAEAFARAILPDIQEFYSHEENIRAFEEWQAERAAQQKETPKPRRKRR